MPTVAVVGGLAFAGGFELALACDFLVASETAVFRCPEVATAMLPLAGALQRLAERVGRARASRFSMLGEPIPGAQAGALGIATHVVSDAQLDVEADALARRRRPPLMSLNWPVIDRASSEARKARWRSSTLDERGSLCRHCWRRFSETQTITVAIKKRPISAA